MDIADIFRQMFTYAIALVVLVGAFILIYQNRGDSGQAWLAIGAILGYVFRDSGGAAATRNAERVAALQPTVTVNPPTTTVSPTPPDSK